MAINKITGKSIKDLDLSADDLAPGTITDAKIATGTIANDKLSNTSITINGTSIALGASGEIVAGTDWQAVTVADGSTTVNATAGAGYFLDTNTGVIEVFLPTSPARGDTVVLVDYAGTFAPNNVIVNTGTTNLDSTTTRQYSLSTNDTIAEFVYVDAEKGWITRINSTAGTTPSGVFNSFGGYDTLPENYPYITATGGTVTTSGDYTIHTFTGDGTFCVQFAGTSPAPSVVDYMVVAGGGSAGFYSSGGGGAGGFRESKNPADPRTASPLATPTGITVSAYSYPITVGAGAPPSSPWPYEPGSQGSNSVFSTITSSGGGGGGGGNQAQPQPGLPGGSGGGGSSPNNHPGTFPGGTGNTPPVSPPQGNNGGTGSGSPGSGGGGGATQAGIDNGNGGAGATTEISGTSTSYAGGGGGCGQTGGSGGGGGPNLAGTANTGGGGFSGGAGGKGIVIIRYKSQ